jgi:hypothetical protein
MGRGLSRSLGFLKSRKPVRASRLVEGGAVCQGPGLVWSLSQEAMVTRWSDGVEEMTKNQKEGEKVKGRSEKKRKALVSKPT